MLLEMLKSKIHRARVTEANLNYVGSITLDKELIEAAGILPGEKVQIVNNNNGARLETYVIEGPPSSGMVCLNGAAARLVQPGDVIIVMAYAWMEAEEAASFKSKVIFPDQDNRLPAAYPFDHDKLDLLFEEVARMVVSTGQGSTSKIQRDFEIEFNRAGRLMDQLERAGVVGKQNGSKPREVLISDPDILNQLFYRLRNSHEK